MSQISRTFANQNLLPRLPIPALKDTIAKYLRSTRPLFASPSAYSAYARIASDFEATLGSDLHKRLEAHAHSFNNGPAESQIQHNTSWIEAWWLKLAYLSWREPLLVNSNWYMLVAPHPHTPVAPLAPFVPLNSSVTSHSCQFTAFQLVRAAGYISNLIDFKDKVDNETMIPETTRTGPLCMNQYRNIFGISRIPVAGCDVLVGAHPSPHQHIVVLVRDQLYVVWVYDKQSGKRLAISEIHRQLCDIVVDVEKSTHMEPPIGVFTGHHRDTWAKWHKYLVELGGNNTESFKWIDTALLTVSLDDVIIPSTLNAHAKATFHGVNGTNRWFDKCLGVVVTQDARIGVNGEHSPCDALVPALAIDQAAKSEPSVDPVGAVIMSSPNSVHRLKWTVDASVHDALVEAKEFVKKLTGNSDVAVLHFTEYGAGLIKKTAKVSPDAFIQMCLQLTYYRLHGACTAVYETASTRKYLHGRTETCRSYSVESKAFVDVFDAKDVPPLKKYELFRTACKNHVETISSAGDGHGVDRHLLGLKLMLKPGEGESPFFTHPVYTQSSTWRLSTSGLFSSDRMHGTGFGAVMPDGYGMNYTIGESIIKIGIESKMDCKTTSSKAFSDEFAVVLREVAQLCRDVEAEVPVAKL
ncbi:hypothetical protein BSLG_004468 [Batrachochytrium salamandrivorans]|nr:hypothetical protein BASA83_001263 [Batrachochytrium salamandrivorans]KAJ1340995.1 hypothetical protein BSLG_004468 [Batrachochytrium salamandrivorans]